MSKFKKRSFDATTVTAGKPVEIYDTDGSNYGTFFVRYCDVHSNAFRLLVIARNKSMLAPERNRMQNPRTEADLDFAFRKNLDFFINAYLVGWDVEGEDGKKIPFAPENAVEYLTAERWIFDALENFSLSSENFFAVSKEDIAKN